MKVDDSMWNVDREACTLCINLEKVKEVMWKSVLEGEQGIDLTKVCGGVYVCGGMCGWVWVWVCVGVGVGTSCGVYWNPRVSCLLKVDTTRNISDFDAEAQAAIQRVTYDHHMKMQGLPTSSDKVS